MFYVQMGFHQRNAGKWREIRREPKIWENMKRRGRKEQKQREMKKNEEE